MPQDIFYTCHLFDRTGRLSTVVKLNCDDDAAAVLAGHAIERDFEHCSGFSVTRGHTLIFRRENYASLEMKPVDFPSAHH